MAVACPTPPAPPNQSNPSDEPEQLRPPIAVIGLGYVGLPLAVEFAKHRLVVGFDINRRGIDTHRACWPLKTST